MLTADSVVGEHVGETLLELQRHAFAHDADAIDGVDERLRLRIEQVADENCDHSRSDGKQVVVDLRVELRSERGQSSLGLRRGDIRP